MTRRCWMTSVLALLMAATGPSAMAVDGSAGTERPAAAGRNENGVVGAAIAGRIVDDDGVPVGSLIVEAHRLVNGRRSGASDLGVTGADGTYVVDRLLPGTYRIQFVGHRTHSGEWWPDAPDEASSRTLVLQGGQVRRIDATLGPVSHVFGRVTTPEGEPLAGVTVSRGLVHDDPNDPEGSDTTDSDGRYRVNSPDGLVSLVLGGVPGYPARYHPSPDGSPNNASEIVVPPSTEVRVDPVMQPAGSVTGTVRRADDGSPVADATVDLRTWDGYHSTTSDADGHYRLDGVTPGPRTVTASRNGPDLLSATAPVDVPAGGETVRDVTIPLAAHLEGTVTDAEGRPLAGATVSIVGYDDETTDDEGRYRFDGLRPGDHGVRFRYGRDHVQQWWPANESNQSVRTVHLDHGETRNGIDAAMRLGATISGRVTAVDPSIRYSPQVRLTSLDDPDVNPAVFMGRGSPGRWTLRGVPPGRYRVSAGSNDSPYTATWLGNVYTARAGRIITVRRGQALSGVDIRLLPGGTVRGRVVTTSGAGAGRTVVVRPRNPDVEGPAETGSEVRDGSWTIDRLTPGVYDVTTRCSADGVESEPRSVRVTGFGDTSITLRLAAGDGRRCEPLILPAGTPQLRGAARVGRTMTVRPLRIRTPDVLVSYSWWAGSRRFANYGTSVRIPRSAHGRRVTVRATLTRTGYRTRTLTSKPTRPVR